MAQLIYNKKRFTQVDKWDSLAESYRGILLSSKLNQKNGQDYKLLDAIDIDWNGTWFKPTASYISTTEELIDAIETLDKSYEISYISNQLDEVVDTYVTQGQLREITIGLQENLKPGQHIEINDDNVIRTYDLISNQALYDFSIGYVSHDYFNEFAYTREQVNEYVTERLNEIIGGANEAFDTLQEVSDWIMDQTTFVPVSYDEIDTNSQTRYYIYDESAHKYKVVNNEYIAQHSSTQYYVIASMRDELENMYSQISYINNERIGNAYWDSEYQIYAYTGILKDINDLRTNDTIISNNIVDIRNSLKTASYNASTAFSLSSIALETSYAAYSLGYIAYELSNTSIENSNNAYEMAYYSYVTVGVASQDGFFKLMSDEELEALNEGDLVYAYNSSGKYYEEVPYVANSSVLYYKYVQPVEATGMHKTIEDIEHVANTALYHLNVDNSKSSYVTLELNPYSYNGDPSRTIEITTKESNYSIQENVIELDGKQYNIQQFDIFSDGFLSAYQMNDIFSYVFEIEKIATITI